MHFNCHARKQIYKTYTSPEKIDIFDNIQIDVLHFFNFVIKLP